MLRAPFLHGAVGSGAARVHRARRLAAWLTLGAVGALAGCLGFSHHPHRTPLPAWAERQGLRRVEVQAGRYIGLSDLSAVRDVDGHRRLYVVPERQRALLQLDLPRPAAPRAEPGGRVDPNDDAPPPETLAARPVGRTLEGVPPYLDTESLAALGNHRFAIGTEAPWPHRTHDDVLLVTLQDHVARATATLRFDYAPYGLTGASNAGIEGLCFDGEALLAASETAGELGDGGRFAPLGRRGPGDTAFVPYRVRLSSETGRISALACRKTSDAPTADTEVLAIERHYGVSRLLRFVLPQSLAPGTLLPAQPVLDLAALVRPLINYEGVAWLADGDVLLLADNSIGFATGPTEGLVVPASMLQSSRP